MIKGKMDYT